MALTLLIFVSMCRCESANSWVRYTPAGRQGPSYPHYPFLGAEAVQRELQHLESQADHDCVLASEVAHKQG